MICLSNIKQETTEACELPARNNIPKQYSNNFLLDKVWSFLLSVQVTLQVYPDIRKFWQDELVYYGRPRMKDIFKRVRGSLY